MIARMLIPTNKQEVRRFAVELVLQFLRLAPDNADMINMLPFLFDLGPFNEQIKKEGGEPAKLKYDLSRQGDSVLLPRSEGSPPTIAQSLELFGLFLDFIAEDVDKFSARFHLFIASFMPSLYPDICKRCELLDKHDRSHSFCFLVVVLPYLHAFFFRSDGIRDGSSRCSRISH